MPPVPPKRTPSALDVTAEFSDPSQAPGPAPAEQPRPLKLGSMIGKYRVSGILGHGGMGTVYAAKDPLIKREVAIKILPPHLVRDRPTLDRFLGEARAAGALNHPHVVTIYEVVEIDDGGYAIIMERVTGGSVQGYLSKKGSPGWRAATRLIGEACKALMAAHEIGLIHRDIKPANLLLNAEGHVKVADFGLAKIDGPESVTQTQPGAILGTPAFMSPEQCRGDKVDARSDLYSLGCTYYAMLTARPPFEAASSMQVMFAHCSAPIPDPRALGADVPPDCVALLNRALAKNADDRYPSAREMLADIRAVLGGMTITASEPDSQLSMLQGIMPTGDEELIAPPMAPVPTGNPAWLKWAITGGVVAVLALIVTLALQFTRTPNPAPLTSTTETSDAGDAPPTNNTTPTPDSSAPQTPPVAAPLLTPPSAGVPQPTPPANVLPPATPPAHQPTVEVAAPPSPVPAVPLAKQPVAESASPTPPEQPAVTWRNDPQMERAFTNSASMKLRLISPGTFTMGDDSLPDAPRHKVTLTQPFYIGTYEVSQGEFKTIMGDQGSEERTAHAELPMAGVSWDDANEFCKRLSERPEEQKAERVYRLPTEAEWEYACRAGTTTRFSNGATLKTGQANFGKKLSAAMIHPDANGQQEPPPQPPQRPRPGQGQGPGQGPGQRPRSQQRPLEPRGGYQANAWGLYDMQGSVWEWCSDFYSLSFDLKKNLTDPTGAPEGDTHVARGGCWNSPGEQCASAYRNGKTDQNPELPIYGFRVVCQVRSELGK